MLHCAKSFRCKELSMRLQQVSRHTADVSTIGIITKGETRYAHDYETEQTHHTGLTNHVVDRPTTRTVTSHGYTRTAQTTLGLFDRSPE